MKQDKNNEKKTKNRDQLWHYQDKKKGSPTAIYDDDSGRRIVGIGRLFVFICLCERDSQAAQGGQVMSPLTASS